MTVRIELFYSPVCPHCPKAKGMLLEAVDNVDQEIHLDEVNVLSHEGLKRAKIYGVTTVPTIIINSRHKIVGVPVQERLNKVINEEIVKSRTDSEKDEPC